MYIIPEEFAENCLAPGKERKQRGLLHFQTASGRPEGGSKNCVLACCQHGLAWLTCIVHYLNSGIIGKGKFEAYPRSLNPARWDIDSGGCMTSQSTKPIVPVILCGGSGTRLWPLSRELYPKPFVKLGNGRTMFMDTLERIQSLGAARPLIISNEQHRFYIQETLEQAGLDAEIILEPEARNTAPALSLAALYLAEKAPASLMLVLPSDHFFDDTESFCRTVQTAAPSAACGHIITFGINPGRPESGYGYIEQGEALDGACFRVTRFVEKPDVEKAQIMLEKGGYYWNSGIFLVSPELYIKEMEKYAPEIISACRNAWSAREGTRFIRPDKDAFLASPANSIDYAIMEKTDCAAMAPLYCGWNDMGSWDSFYQAGQPDGSANVTYGDVIAEDVENSYIHAEDRLVAAVGLKDMVIVESRDAVLVLPRERTQEVKKIVDSLRNDKRDEFRLHPLVYRPWGSYERLAIGPRFQVKRIIVKPKCSLSLQLHHHRSEHWIVVRGTAEITIDKKTSIYTENESAYIPLGKRHKLRNPGIIPLELIEVQSGSYLGEDDIIRIKDDYGRDEI